MPAKTIDFSGLNDSRAGTGACVWWNVSPRKAETLLGQMGVREYQGEGSAPSLTSFIPHTIHPTMPFLKIRDSASGCSATLISRGERIPKSRTV